mgnify:CR=1 FL=1
MSEMKNMSESSNVKLTLKLKLWNPLTIVVAPTNAVQTLLSILAFAFFFEPIFQALGFSNAKLLSVLVPFLMFVFSAINIVFVERQYESKKIYSGVNLGGAIMPVLLAIYFMSSVAKAWLIQELIILTFALYISYSFSAVESEGVVILSIPIALSCALATLFLVHNPIVAPMLAYSSSVLGVVFADIINLKKVIEVTDSNGSIGSFGLVDAISMTGLFSLAIVYFALLLFHA